MTTSLEELSNIAALAHLEIDDQGRQQLALDLNDMMAFVQHLCVIDTKNNTPLLHPLDLVQPLRKDILTEQNCLNQLAKLAPKFEDGLYLVPKVIDTGK